MNEQTLEALHASIRHWEEMAKNGWKNEQPEMVQCPLCRMFRGPGYKEDCGACPIAAAGYPLCEGTPYVDADSAFEESEESAFLEHASREVDFLKSLLLKPGEQSRNGTETLQF